MEKHQRHRLIARLLSSGEIRSQEQLREKLAAEGVQTTQGTLSRDLREMGVVKGPGGYALPSAPVNRGQSELSEALTRHMKSAELAGTLVVLHTEPGHAQAVAVQLDASPPPGAVGTIAGDDTIFIAARSAREAAALLRTVRQLGGAR